MGVSLMGLPLDSHYAHYLAPEQFKAITQWIQGVALVGELHTADVTTIQHTLNHYQLDYLQLSHPVDSAVMDAIELPILLRIVLQGYETEEALNAWLAYYAPFVSYFLIETTSTSQATFNRLQKQVGHLAGRFPILQGFNIAADNLTYLVEQTSLQGIALQGGVEIRPGYKDYEHLAAILELLARE